MNSMKPFEEPLSCLQQPPTLLTEIKVMDVIKYGEAEYVFDSVINEKRIALKMACPLSPSFCIKLTPDSS